MLAEYETNMSGTRKSLCRTSENDEMSELCLNSFQDATKRYMPVSMPLIQKKLFSSFILICGKL